MHWILEYISFIHVFQCFHFSFTYINYMSFRKDTILNFLENNDLYVYFIFHVFQFYLFIFFLDVIFLINIFMLFFLSSAQNSLNSRADLEFKEFRLFSTIIVQQKC